MSQISQFGAAQKAYDHYNRASAAIQPHYQKAQPYLAKIQAVVEPYIAPIDRELSRFPSLVRFEQQTGIKKAYLGLAVFGIFAFFIFFNIFASLLTNALGFFIPAYYSMKALRTPDGADDTQWLTYWSVYGFFAVLESIGDHILYWFPFYYTAKALILIWLMLPQTQGAKIVYANVLRPFFFHTRKGTVPQGYNGTDTSGLFAETPAHARSAPAPATAPAAAPAPAAAAPSFHTSAPAPTAASSAVPEGLSSLASHAQAPAHGSGVPEGLSSFVSPVQAQAPGAGAGGFHVPPEAQAALQSGQVPHIDPHNIPPSLQPALDAITGQDNFPRAPSGNFGL